MRLEHLVDGEAEDDYKRLEHLRAMVTSPEVRFVRPAPKPERRGGGKLALGAEALVPVLNDKMKLHLQQHLLLDCSQTASSPEALWCRNDKVTGPKPLRRECVECLFLRTPSPLQDPFRCVLSVYFEGHRVEPITGLLQRATKGRPTRTPVVPHPESIAVQAAYTRLYCPDLLRPE
jgi:hypothetical protein